MRARGAAAQSAPSVAIIREADAFSRHLVPAQTSCDFAFVGSPDGRLADLAAALARTIERAGGRRAGDDAEADLVVSLVDPARLAGEGAARARVLHTPARP